MRPVSVHLISGASRKTQKIIISGALRGPSGPPGGHPGDPRGLLGAILGAPTAQCAHKRPKLEQLLDHFCVIRGVIFELFAGFVFV